MKKITLSWLMMLACGAAMAKLPALGDDAKAKAAEAAAKAAWAAKVEGYQLCKSQDAVAAGYFKAAKVSGKAAKAAAPTAACADPGAFVYPPPAQAAAAPAAAPVPAQAAPKPAGKS